jgi:hypothetical protein
MKETFPRLVIIFIGLLFFSSAVWGQEMPTEKIALYTKYYELKKGGAEGQKVAYEVAKEYLQKFGADTDLYTEAVRKFVVAYDKASREVSFYKAYNAKEYAKTFEIGRQILSAEPDNFAILGSLSRAGYFNAYAGSKSLNSDTAELVTRALDLIESGKVTKPDPFASFDEARGFLNYVLGFVLQEQSPAEAAAALLKAARVGGTRNEPATFYYLGNAILKGEYEPLSEEYRLKHAGKDETSEGKAMFERLMSIGNRAIDAYARAVALSTRPEQAKFKSLVLAEVTELYKSFHNNSDAGLSELIATVLSKPMP